MLAIAGGVDALKLGESSAANAVGFAGARIARTSASALHAVAHVGLSRVAGVATHSAVGRVREEVRAIRARGVHRRRTAPAHIRALAPDFDVAALARTQSARRSASELESALNATDAAVVVVGERVDARRYTIDDAAVFVACARRSALRTGVLRTTVAASGVHRGIPRVRPGVVFTVGVVTASHSDNQNHHQASTHVHTLAHPSRASTSSTLAVRPSLAGTKSK